MSSLLSPFGGDGGGFPFGYILYQFPCVFNMFLLGLRLPNAHSQPEKLVNIHLCGLNA